MKTLKHFGKRGLAILLALVMCVGMLNLTVFAVDGETSVGPAEGIAEIEVPDEAERSDDKTGGIDTMLPGAQWGFAIPGLNVAGGKTTEPEDTEPETTEPEEPTEPEQPEEPGEPVPTEPEQSGEPEEPKAEEPEQLEEPEEPVIPGPSRSPSNNNYNTVEGAGDDPVTPAPEYVAEVNNQQYTTLAAAVAAVPANSTATIKLLKDVKLTSRVSIGNGKNITLDMGGKTISGTGLTLKEGTLTLKNGSIIVPTTDAEGDAAVYVYGSGSDVAAYNALTVEADAYLEGYWVICVMGSGNSCYGVNIDIYGELNGCIFVSGNIGNTEVMLSHI